jgi:hypothetical protein
MKINFFPSPTALCPATKPSADSARS